MIKFPSKITYMKKAQNALYQFRNVILDKDTFSKIIPGKKMHEKQWRELGIQGSQGWQHFNYCPSLPHILMLRKPKNKATKKYIKQQPLQRLNTTKQNQYDNLPIIKEQDRIQRKKQFYNQNQLQDSDSEGVPVPQIKLFQNSSQSSQTQKQQYQVLNQANRNIQARKSFCLSRRNVQKDYNQKQRNLSRIVSKSVRPQRNQLLSPRTPSEFYDLRYYCTNPNAISKQIQCQKTQDKSTTLQFRGNSTLQNQRSPRHSVNTWIGSKLNIENSMNRLKPNNKYVPFQTFLKNLKKY